MRVCLFTDTLADVNGVSRFIRNIAQQAQAQGRDLTVITSTRLDCPRAPNIVNVRPPAATQMPGYANLEVVLPPAGGLWRAVKRIRPDAVHVSTPGPVGTVGLLAAKRLGVPLVGTYHTDFPAYIHHLFDDTVFTWLTNATMRGFYRRFTRIFTRSDDYATSLVNLGVRRDRIVRLLPGIDTGTFHVKHRAADPHAFWRGYHGVDPEAVKVLYVGRVSVEKNLPMLASMWAKAGPELVRRGIRAQLIVVGDGPYRQTMQSQLGGVATDQPARASGSASADAVFLGFRHGQELSTIYATADLFVFPSLTDTLGQVVLEAQSAGLPVLVSDKGGPSEVVDRGRTGFVLPSEDPGAWVQALVELAAFPARRAEMGRAGHAKVQPMSIADSFGHFWSVHEEAAGARPGA